MGQKWTLKVLDAKSAHRAWSKRRTLVAIVAAAIAASVAAPAVARAEEAQALPAEQPAIEVVAEQAAPASETVPGQPAEAVVPEAPTGELAAPADVTPAEGAQGPVEVAQGEASAETPTDEGQAEETPAEGEAGLPGAGAAAEEEPQEAAPSQPAQGSGATDAQADATQGETPLSPLDPSAAEDPEGQSLEEATAGKEADSLGTKIVFDFNGDGKTDAQDWKDYLKWMADYKAFDFDLETGDLGDSHNGGIQITGATQIIANGHGKRLDSIDTNLDVAKISQYYLNNVGLATSVKNQSPWGTCWSFASISALESAILKAQTGATPVVNPDDHMKPILSGLDDKGVDLSELYLAWMAYDLQSMGSQKGEGIIDVLPCDTNLSDRLNCGGWATMAETLFGSWQGMATEAEQAYWPQGVPKTYEEFKKKYDYMGEWNVSKDNGAPSAHVDGIYYLPDPNVLAMDKRDHIVWQGFDATANDLIKQAILKYGAVQIGYGADTSRDPGKSNGDYFNYDSWAQYCDATNIEITHAVTIVGWDDNFDPSNFRAGKNDISKLKPGAWLIKNSWGSAEWYMKNFGLSEDEVRAKHLGWGLPDPETGLPTGYFWLSYYDHSINSPSFFSVNLPKDGKFKYDNNYSYDHLINESQSPFVFKTADGGTWVSNVFKAKGDEILKAVSVHTSQPQSHAKILVYLVNEDGLRDNDPTNDGGPVLSMDYDALIAGMHTVDLIKPIQLKAGQLFAIVENITCLDGTPGAPDGVSSLINLETGMAQKAQFPYPDDLESKGRAMGYLWTTVKANPGETFIKILTKAGYRWITPQQLSEAFFGGNVFEFGNALVKAFTCNGLLPVPADGAEEEPAIVAHVEGASGKTSVEGAEPVEVAKTASVRSASGSEAALPQTGDATSNAPIALGALAAALLSAGYLVRRRGQE